jgi:hypothetical protein
MVGGFIFGILTRILWNAFRNKKTDKLLSEEEISEMKRRLHRIIDMGRAKYVKAKNELDHIKIKLEGEGVKTLNLILYKETHDLDCEGFIIKLTPEEYDKLYNAIYFYII